jgi:molybdopterin molybdotransferase
VNKLDLLAVSEARRRVLEGVHALAAEMVPVSLADERVLAKDILARRTQPPADMSAMDGYAVRAADVARPGAVLVRIGVSAAGTPFAGAVGQGQAVRIFTGALMPDGADSVVIQENTRAEGDQVVVQEPVQPGRNVRRLGIDFEAGRHLLLAGRRLDAAAMALAAAANHATLPVIRRPHVVIFSTGDELVAPGGEPGPGQIVSSNAIALAALARKAGARVTDLGIIPDKLDRTIEAVREARALGADLLLTSGGASVGEFDLIKPALAAESIDIAFWKLALRPGKPLMFARSGAMHVLGLPGNPVSSYVCAVLFALPLLQALQGEAPGPVWEKAVLGSALPANDHREEYLRASLTVSEGLPVATPATLQDSSLISVLAQADCLILRPAHGPAMPAGSPCQIIRL